MTGWTFARAHLPAQAARAFADLDSVFGLEGERIAKDPLSQVIRVEFEGVRYYVKRYTGAGKNPLRRWIGRPRVQAEWENLQAFSDWGIPTAMLIGFGLERSRAGFTRGALITEEIRDTEDLARIAHNNDPRLRNRAWVEQISRQVADITRRMHKHDFVHNDLKWRNLLVTSGEAPQVYLIDCPSGMRWPQPFLRYRITKDLACLDKVAKHQFSRPQRLRFYLYYTGQTRLTASDKKHIGNILHFFKGRE